MNDQKWTQRRQVRLLREHASSAWRIAGVMVVLSMLVGVVLSYGVRSGQDSSAVEAAAGCRIYVASGDDYTNGKEMDDNENRYPEKLLADHLVSPGWCLFNQGANEQTSSSYISDGGLSNAYNMRPDLLTIQLGEQNPTIVNAIDSCFDKVRDHDFAGASGCASAITANSSLWKDLAYNYTTILQQTRIMAAQRPGLVIAVVGYPNPYPRAEDVVDEIAQLCTPLIDTTLTCVLRWVQLPAALLTLDQVFVKLNATLKKSLGPFQQGPNGSRWVFVDTYPKMEDHCMKMEVEIKTKVEHPEQSGAVHDHNSPKVNFGCSEPWFVEGDDGTAKPNYLIPATPGVLVEWSQTTSGMGVYPNADGHKCIADSIWEADTIDPGTTPLKWKLRYGEPSDSDICQ